MTLRPGKHGVPEHNGDPHLSRDQRRWLLTLASQMLTSGAACLRVVAVAGAFATLTAGTIVTAGITQIDVGPIHVTVSGAAT